MKFLLISMALFLPSLACSIFTVKQETFPPLSIQAERPDAPPARVVLTDSNIKITEKIQFEFDSAEIKSESYDLLNEIGTVLKDNPQIEIVSIEGHTDATGDAAYNRRLSESRAKSVRAHLIKWGIKTGRLQFKGFGPDKPMASNDDAKGQEKNRRVEFRIVKQGKKKTLVEED